MKIKHVKQFINRGIYAFLLAIVFVTLPFTAKSQSEIYYGNQGEVLATSDTRMIITILETPDHVELQLGGVGKMLASGFAFSLLYNHHALILTDENFQRDIPQGNDPYTLGKVITLDPNFLLHFPRMTITNAIDHQPISDGTMKYMNSEVALGSTKVSESMDLVAGQMLPVYKIFFRKAVPGAALQTSDLGFYSNPKIPRISSYWGYNAVTVRHGVLGGSDAGYSRENLFVYRSPSFVITDSVTHISENAASLHGTFARGKFAPSNTMQVSSKIDTKNTGRLNYDDIHEYGFIYSANNDSLFVNGITNKITVNGVEYNFPSAAQIASASGVLTFGTDTLHFIPFANSSSNQAVPFDAQLTGLTTKTEYYVWTYERYSFETSDTYLAVGNKLIFSTVSCETPDSPIALLSQSFCGTPRIADLSATVTAKDTLFWYDADTGGNVYLPTDLLVDGNTYYAVAKTGSCLSAATAVTVSISKGLLPPIATSPQTLCSGALVSDLQAQGDSIVWYDAPTGGNILNRNTLLTDGFYYAALKMNSCESEVRSKVKVTIKETVLDPPAIASPQHFCNYATLADIATDGSNIVWYSEQGALLPLSTALSNAKTYYAAKVAGTCESTERTPVLVYTAMEGFIDPPVVASPQRFCEGAAIASIRVPNNQIRWYATATDTVPISSSTLLSDKVTYYAAQKAGECESTERTPVRILFNNPQGPDVVSPQIFCGTNFTLDDLTITGAGVVWYDSPVGGNLLPSNTALTNTPVWYYAAQSSSDCETSRVGVLAYFNTAPETPVISDDIIVCADEKTIDLTSAVETKPNVAYTYYFNGEIINDPETVPVPEQNSIYYVKATNIATACESELLAEIKLTISYPPVVSVSPAGAYTTINDTVLLTVTDNNTNQAAGAKTVSILDGNIASVQLVNGTLKIAGKAGGNTEVLYTSVNEDGCVTRLVIPVQIGGSPTAVLTGKDIVLCGDDSLTTVQIAYVMGGVSPWTVTVSDSRGTFSKDTLIHTAEEFPVNVSVKIPKNKSNVAEYTTYVVSNVVDALGSSKQTHYGAVRVGVNPVPVIHDIANRYQLVCAGDRTLPVSFDGVATSYKWSIDKNIGIENYSTGVMRSFVAVNETSDSVKATILITPEYRLNGVVCTGDTDTAYIIVLPAANANFVAQHIGLGGVRFADRSSANAVAWAWDFGDDSTSTLQNPEHTYKASGTYTVTLTVETEAGCKATVTKEIKVSVFTDVLADFSLNESKQCLSGNEFLFTDKSKTTAEGHYISAWHWNFGNGDTSVLRNPVHVYDSAGTYTVTLTVTEMPMGGKYSVSYRVKVMGVPLITDGAAPDAVCAGERLRVSSPSIDWKGNDFVAGQWLLGGRLFDPYSMPITAADNGKLLQYRVETPCGVAISKGDTVKVYTTPEILLESSLIEICDNVTVVKIPYTANVAAGTAIYYSIAYDVNARRGGFVDVTNGLLADDTIRIAIPVGLAEGYYGGILSIKADNHCDNTFTSAFDIHKTGKFSIVQQPTPPVTCGRVTLSVVADASDLKYQWYHNGVAIVGANASVYSFDYDPSLNGEYYVELSNSCMSLTSAKVNVNANAFTIEMKWDNVLYVNDPQHSFSSFQWYKDGQPVSKDGYAQYYGEEFGFDGTYHVRCYYADGSYIETCPLEVHTKKTAKVVLYPNPAEAGSRVILEIHTSEVEVENASLEIFDAAARLVYKGTVTHAVTEFTVPVVAGIYTAKVITTDGHTFVERFVVGL
ncbi:MAG: PKD domain-containing protein [Bacteroidales bacterium]|jgi:PKD repeat protein|nr:PKD domain-containing protein [Bacteroidales bacterium]